MSYVVKAKTGRVMGRYATKAEAEARTRQLARQAEALKAHRFGKGAGRGVRGGQMSPRPQKWTRPSHAEMFANGKPIVVTKVGRRYTVHVMGHPAYVGPEGLTFFGRPGAVQGAQPYAFKSKSEADGIAHKIGRYMLGLGDFVYTYVEHR